VHADHRHAGLGQAAGQQAGLADRVPAVGVADRGRFGREIEGPRHPRSGEQVERPVLIGVEGADGRGGVQRPAMIVESFQEGPPRTQPRRRGGPVGGDGLDDDLVWRQVLVDHQRAVGRAQEPGRLAVQDRPVESGHGGSDLDPTGEPVRRAELVQHAADGREVGGGRWEIASRLGAGRMVAAGHRRQRGLNVVGVGVSQRANHGDLVHEPGRPREQLAEAHAGHARRDGAERTALGVRPDGFRVPGLLLRGPAVKVDHDHRAGAAEGGLGRPGR
jgi:hypothetical protein